MPPYFGVSWYMYWCQSFNERVSVSFYFKFEFLVVRYSYIVNCTRDVWSDLIHKNVLETNVMTLQAFMSLLITYSVLCVECVIPWILVISTHFIHCYNLLEVIFFKRPTKYIIIAKRFYGYNNGCLIFYKDVFR